MSPKLGRTGNNRKVALLVMLVTYRTDGNLNMGDANQLSSQHKGDLSPDTTPVYNQAEKAVS